MPVQDLTPQLRTRLSRVERAVGWFVILATVLLLTGFSYYVYSTAKRKGWFVTKLRYHTFVDSAVGLRPGDPVRLMGFDVGQVTSIEAMPPFSYANIYIEFNIREPYNGYIWTDSYVKLTSAGFLGSRALEVVQGGTTTNQNLHAAYKIDEKTGTVQGVWDPKTNNYVPYTAKSKGFGFDKAREAPIITERLDELAKEVRDALPGVFNLTNELARVLTNTAKLTARADDMILQVQPVLTNVLVISALLTNGPGAFGEWAIPTNLNRELEQTLASTRTTITSANTNVTTIARTLNLTLENLANITSNLNAQVQSNDQILAQISSTIVTADQFVQGLKRHWLLRSAFKGTETNQPADRPTQPGLRPPPAGTRSGKRLP